MSPVDDAGLRAGGDAASSPDAHPIPRRLRVAVLSRNFDSSGGGAERYAVAVAQRLVPQQGQNSSSSHSLLSTSTG